MHTQGNLRVQLGGRLHGTVALSDVHDVYVANALTGLQEGGFVRARALASMSPGDSKLLPRVTLSLRPSEGGAVPDAAAVAAATAVQVNAVVALLQNSGSNEEELCLGFSKSRNHKNDS